MSPPPEVVAPEEEEEEEPLFDEEAPLPEFRLGVPEPEKEACVMSREKPLYKLCWSILWEVESLDTVSPVGPRAKMNGCVVDVVSIDPRDHLVQFLHTAMSWSVPSVRELDIVWTSIEDVYCGCWCPVESRGLRVTPVAVQSILCRHAEPVRQEQY